MQSTSATYDTLFAAGAPAEIRVTIDPDGSADEYGMDRIVSCSIERDMLEDIGLGTATAAQLTLVLQEYDPIPRMAEMLVEIRLNDGVTQSEWLPCGTFFLDTREEEYGGKIRLHGYDAMLKADYSFVYGGDTMTTAAAVSQICGVMGIALDSSVSITEYTIPRGQPYTCREMLGYIGVSQGGSWVVSPDNKLRLVPLANVGAAVQTLGLGVMSLQMGEPITISGVEVVFADGQSYIDGDSSTYMLTVDCPWGTQAMATALYGLLDGISYQPYQITGAGLNPAVELGDNISIDDPAVTVPVVSVAWRYASGTVADVSAPHDQEVDHEYPYKSETERQFERLASYIQIGAVQDPEGSGQMVAGISILNSTSSVYKLVETGTGLYFIYEPDGTVVMKLVQVNGRGVIQMGAFGFTTFNNGNFALIKV